MANASEVRRRGRKAAGPKPSQDPIPEIPFGRKNYMIFALAGAVIIAGYVALSRGSITLAPILLLTGYLVLIPWGILARERRGGE